jgi:F0F1-type ATP synthase delta subunit
MVFQVIIIQIITFVALVLFLRMLFQRHLNAALARLKELQEQAMMKESQLEEELRKAKDERAAEVEKGRLDAQALVEAAKKETEAMRMKAEEEGKAELLKVSLHQKEDLEKQRQAMLAEMEERAVSLSTEIIRYTFSDKGKQNLQHDLITEVIGEIEKVSRDKFPPQVNAVEVVSPLPLLPEELQRLEKALAAKIGGSVPALTQLTDPQLITGLVVKIGNFVIDGSLKNKMQKAIPFLEARR